MIEGEELLVTIGTTGKVKTDYIERDKSRTCKIWHVCTLSVSEGGV